MKRLSFVSNRHLAQAFEAIVVATTTASALILGCGGLTGSSGEASGGFSYEGFTKVQPLEACEKPLTLLAGIHPAHENAAIQRRTAMVGDAYLANARDGGVNDTTRCPDGIVSNTLVESYGEACALATDKPKCTQLVACVTPPGTGWLTYSCSGPCSMERYGSFYLEVNGDTLTFPTDLVAMLGSIDTPSEAVLVANKLGYTTPTGCSDPLPGAYRAVAGGYELLVLKHQECGNGLMQLRVRINADGTSEVLETKEIKPPSGEVCPVGRRPEGFTLAEPGGAARGVVAYLTELAALEAASVTEFARLRDELRSHGAPLGLIAGAESGRRDEIVHARLMHRLVRMFGGKPSKVSIDPRASRSLEALAIHNAVEGCVRETFGALSATWQARHAAHPEIASAFARIAVDETRHAAFSWELATWLEGSLDHAARTRVAKARTEALEELRVAVATAPDDEVAALAGVAPPAIARHLLAEMGDCFALDSAA